MGLGLRFEAGGNLDGDGAALYPDYPANDRNLGRRTRLAVSGAMPKCDTVGTSMREGDTLHPHRVAAPRLPVHLGGV